LQSAHGVHLSSISLAIMMCWKKLVFPLYFIVVYQFLLINFFPGILPQHPYKKDDMWWYLSMYAYIKLSKKQSSCSKFSCHQPNFGFSRANRISLPKLGFTPCSRRVPCCEHATKARTNIRTEKTDSFTASVVSQTGQSISTI
jgi:hypothetical protein